MTNYTIPRSRKGLEMSMVSSAGFLVAVGLIVTVFFAFVVAVRQKVLIIVLLSFWLGMLVIWAIGWFLVLKKWDKTSFTLAEDCLIAKKGQFFGSQRELYRYDSILSVSVHQSFWGERYNYGTIEVTIPKAEGYVSIAFAADPTKQAELIKRAIASKSNGTQSLIN